MRKEQIVLCIDVLEKALARRVESESPIYAGPGVYTGPFVPPASAKEARELIRRKMKLLRQAQVRRDDALAQGYDAGARAEEITIANYEHAIKFFSDWLAAR